MLLPFVETVLSFSPRPPHLFPPPPSLVFPIVSCRMVSLRLRGSHGRAQRLVVLSLLQRQEEKGQKGVTLISRHRHVLLSVLFFSRPWSVNNHKRTLIRLTWSSVTVDGRGPRCLHAQQRVMLLPPPHPSTATRHPSYQKKLYRDVGEKSPTPFLRCMRHTRSGK